MNTEVSHECRRFQEAIAPPRAEAIASRHSPIPWPLFVIMQKCVECGAITERRYRSPFAGPSILEYEGPSTQAAWDAATSEDDDGDD